MNNFLLFSLFSFFTINLFYSTAQQDTCLKLFCSNNYSVITNMGSYNPDSVKVDTCPESQTYGKIFAKRYFELKFTQYPFDTAITSGVLKGVNDLRNDIPGLKQQFQDLEQELGNIFFSRDYPHVSIPDDSICKNKCIVFVIFEEYQDVEYIQEIFEENIDSLIRIRYITRYGFPMSMPSDIALKPTTKLNEIYQNFKQDRDFENNLWYEFYPINFEPYGFQSNIYEVNCPMAWEISKGSNNIYIGISDFFNSTNGYSNHPDILSNYRKYTSLGNGTYWNSDLLIGHGMGAMSNAVAIESNNFPMVGTAPLCMAIAFEARRSAFLFDLDGETIGNKFKYIDVKNCSYGFPDDARMVSNDIDVGIVVVAAAGNDRAQLHGGESDNNIRKAVLQPDGSYELQPSIMNPAASVYTNANPDLDYRIISVGATQSGYLRNKYTAKRGNITILAADIEAHYLFII